MILSTSNGKYYKFESITNDGTDGVKLTMKCVRRNGEFKRSVTYSTYEELLKRLNTLHEVKETNESIY